MKRNFFILILALTAASGRAQTSNLTSLLQQGLLEEEGTRDLNAAISNYQSIAAQFDNGRQVAATAIYRLGECYRKLNRTNEAVAQYSRIVREFSDQQSLATLSQQNIEGLGGARQSAVPGAGGGADSLRVQYTLLKAQIERARGETNAEHVADIFHDQPYADALRNLIGNRQGRAAGSTEAVQLDPLIKEYRQKLLDNQELRLKILQAAMGQARSGQVAEVSTEGESAPALDNEDQEIGRIQRMIQNSPDLVNSGELGRAAAAGELRVAAFLLDHGADVNAEHTGRLPLNEAAKSAQKTMVELLLSRGADVNGRDGADATPLLRALARRFTSVVKVLLAHHADVNAPYSGGDDGRAPLHVAAENGDLDLVKLLLDAGANPNVETQTGRTPLSYAANGSPEIVKLLLTAKADPNGGKMDAPLLSAIHKQDLVSANLLLQAGANPNAKGIVDWQVYAWDGAHVRGTDIEPLFLAVSTGQLPMTQLLLKNKADPSVAEPDGRPFLCRGAFDTNMLKALLDAGANVETTGTEVVSGPPGIQRVIQRTPLEAAAGNDSSNAVELLLKHGANPNARDVRGDTALHWAAFKPADVNVFNALLEHKANPNVRDENGKTPLDLLRDRLRGAGTEWQTRLDNLVDVLHQNGALDNPPKWDSIQVIPASTHIGDTVLQKDTNGWNRLSLVEAIFDYYASGLPHLMPGSPQTFEMYLIRPPNMPGPPGRAANAMPFPDLARVVILRPSHNSTNITKIPVNLIDSTNAIDCAKDMPLEFGDMVEIPQCDHPLGAAPWTLNDSQISAMINYLHGTAHLVARDQKADLPLDPWGNLSMIGAALHQTTAQQILLASSDLAHVKVTRRDPKTGREREWIVDCSGSQSPPLVLRDGDVISVPERP